MKPSTLCLTLLLVLAALRSSSQNTYIPQWQAWFRYYSQTQLSEKFALHAEVDDRRILNPSHHFQFFSHVHLHHRIMPWLDVAAGFNFNTTRSPVNPSLHVPELRPWQEVTLIKNFQKELLFQFRYRLDERFIHNHDNEVLMDGYHFNWRHRFRILFSKPIVEFKNGHTLTLKLSDEVMLNSGDVPRHFDQNRLFVSLEIKLNDHWSIESGYLNIIQPITNDVYYERQVIRSTLHHRMDARKRRS